MTKIKKGPTSKTVWVHKNGDRIEIAQKAERMVDGGGQRFDAGKVRLDLIPADVQLALAQVLTHGAAKYAPRNFERGMPWSKAYGPLLRHLNARCLGARVDPESGLPHLAHALCNLVFLLAWELRGMEQFEDLEPFLRGRRGKAK